MSKSENLYHAARELIPGGVNSPVRALPASAAHRYLSNARMALTSMTWMGKPISIMSVPGSDGAGPQPPGYPQCGDRGGIPRPELWRADRNGSENGGPVTELVPTMDMVRMVNSGTEATMSAIRRRAASPGATKSLSSKAATTAMPTACW